MVTTLTRAGTLTLPLSQGPDFPTAAGVNWEFISDAEHAVTVAKRQDSGVYPGIFNLNALDSTLLDPTGVSHVSYNEANVNLQTAGLNMCCERNGLVRIVQQEQVGAGNTYALGSAAFQHPAIGVTTNLVTPPNVSQLFFTSVGINRFPFPNVPPIAVPTPQKFLYGDGAPQFFTLRNILGGLTPMTPTALGTPVAAALGNNISWCYRDVTARGLMSSFTVLAANSCGVFDVNTVSGAWSLISDLQLDDVTANTSFTNAGARSYTAFGAGWYVCSITPIFGGMGFRLFFVPISLDSWYDVQLVGQSANANTQIAQNQNSQRIHQDINGVLWVMNQSHGGNGQHSFMYVSPDMTLNLPPQFMNTAQPDFWNYDMPAGLEWS